MKEIIFYSNVNDVFLYIEITCDWSCDFEPWFECYKTMVLCILIVIIRIMYCLLLYVLRFNVSVADP